MSIKRVTVDTGGLVCRLPHATLRTHIVLPCGTVFCTNSLSGAHALAYWVTGLAMADASKRRLVLQSAEGGKRVVATLDDKLPSSPLAIVAQETAAAAAFPTPRFAEPDASDGFAMPYMHSSYISSDHAKIFTRSVLRAAAVARGDDSPRRRTSLFSGPDSRSQGSFPPVRASGAMSSQSTATLPSVGRVGSASGPLGRSSALSGLSAKGPKRSTSSAALLARNAALVTEPKPTYVKRVQEQVSGCRAGEEWRQQADTACVLFGSCRPR